jgi:suppressor of G2 allele of SKP1
MAAQAAKGSTFLADGKHQDAIEQFTLALKSNPESPDYYIKRSTAHQRNSPPNYEEALKDAEIAIVAATKRARREQILQGQLRRAMALFGLERYADARFVLGIVKQMNPEEKTLPIWENKIQAKLKTLEEGDARAKRTVEKIPNVDIPLPEKETKAAGKAIVAGTAQPVAPDSVTSTLQSQTPSEKIKIDWYQSLDNVYFTLLARGVPKDKATISIEPNSVSISFPTVSGSDFEYSLDPLFALIDTSASSFNITPTKVEVVLKKAVVQKWSGLEGTVPLPTSSGGSDEALPNSQDVLRAALAESAPSYPTSSRSGPKNWDKLANDVDDKEGEDDVSSFFQSLYKGSNPDTRRAMMKSYQESNGTVLSTDWGSVGKKKVETSPPDGMVAKNWDE